MRIDTGTQIDPVSGCRRAQDETDKVGLRVCLAVIDETVRQYGPTANVCAFGIADEMYGEQLALALVSNIAGTGLVQRLQQWISDHPAQHKQSARWCIANDIPRASPEKFNRRAEARSCQSLEAPDLSAFHQDVKWLVLIRNQPES